MSCNCALRSPLNHSRFISPSVRLSRAFSASCRQNDEALQNTPPPHAPPPPPGLDLSSISTNTDATQSVTDATATFGSRRRRAALATSQNIPFEQLPYQCFQEARKILQADRLEKLKRIDLERRRIALVAARDAATMGSEATKKGKLMAMEKFLEELKILADINDPVIKKRFEDGLGDMSRPIYRHLANEKWRSYKRRLLMQRLTQMHVVPDILPHLDPVAEVSLAFGRRNVAAGDWVDALISEQAPKLFVQVFDKGPRLVTIAVVDPDVPNTETDAFDYRCHYLAANIPLDSTAPRILFECLNADEQVILPWMPPHAQKGSPYHRLAVFVLQQEEGRQVDVAAAKERVARLGFNLRSFNDRHRLKAVGATMFRNKWDEGTRKVMERAGLEGADVELKRKKPEKGPYKRKDGERYR